LATCFIFLSSVTVSGYNLLIDRPKLVRIFPSSSGTCLKVLLMPNQQAGSVCQFVVSFEGLTFPSQASRPDLRIICVGPCSRSLLFSSAFLLRCAVPLAYRAPSPRAAVGGRGLTFPPSETKTSWFIPLYPKTTFSWC